MNNYLQILDKVLKEGVKKENRTGKSTLVLPTQFFEHDMSTGFPLVTTKKMPPRTIFTELEGFIGCITDKRWYQERGCRIWDEWQNPHGSEFDLGPIYGYQWRRFDLPYMDNGPINTKRAPHEFPLDQLNTVIQTLKTDPDDRRMHVSAWNPNQASQMALPPCHLSFTIQHIDGVINLTWVQRSCDMFLGIPFNIASYAMLLTLIAKETGMKVGMLYGVWIDCHVYADHVLGCLEQVQREPRNLPTIAIDNWTNIWEWEATDVRVLDYDPHPKIYGAVAV